MTATGPVADAAAGPVADAAAGPVADAAAPAAGTLTIRRVRDDEHAEAGRVTEEAYLASYDGLTDQYRLSLRDVARRVTDGEVWVAVDDGGAILGTVWVPRPGERLSELARDGELDFRQLAVAPAARGRGVGAALTRHVIALARRRGARRVVMNSGPEMTGAHALYHKLGFRRLHDREAPIEVEPGRWLDLRTFALDLDPALALEAGPETRV